MPILIFGQDLAINTKNLSSVSLQENGWCIQFIKGDSIVVGKATLAGKDLAAWMARYQTPKTLPTGKE